MQTTRTISQSKKKKKKKMKGSSRKSGTSIDDAASFRLHTSFHWFHYLSVKELVITIKRHSLFHQSLIHVSWWKVKTMTIYHRISSAVAWQQYQITVKLDRFYSLFTILALIYTWKMSPGSSSVESTILRSSSELSNPRVQNGSVPENLTMLCRLVRFRRVSRRLMVMDMPEIKIMHAA